MSYRYIDTPGAYAFELARERGFMCEWCKRKKGEDAFWRPNQGTELHHALIRRDVRFKRHLDVDENFCLVCHDCHMSGDVDTREFRQWFFRIQVKRYGMERMAKWMDSLPFEISPIDFL